MRAFFKIKSDKPGSSPRRCGKQFWEKLMLKRSLSYHHEHTTEGCDGESAVPTVCGVPRGCPRLQNGSGCPFGPLHCSHLLFMATSLLQKADFALV